MKNNHENEITIKISRETHAAVKKLAKLETRSIKGIVDLAVKCYEKNG